MERCGKDAGALGFPLTERGREQALAHGRQLTRLAIPDCCWVSSAGRTRATADLIRGSAQVPQHFSDALLERDCGTWSGKTLEQVRASMLMSGPARADHITIDRVAAKTYRIYWLDFVSFCCGGNSRIVGDRYPGVVSRAILGHFCD